MTSTRIDTLVDAKNNRQHPFAGGTPVPTLDEESSGLLLANLATLGVGGHQHVGAGQLLPWFSRKAGRTSLFPRSRTYQGRVLRPPPTGSLAASPGPDRFIAIAATERETPQKASTGKRGDRPSVTALTRLRVGPCRTNPERALIAARL
jgi:hypothetical protein